MAGIRIVEDIFTMPGIETLEGRVGPLLHAARGSCHYIDIPAGAYMDEHPHETESLIFTVRGRWVLCSGGERRLMRTGTLFWFGDNVPTGYEVPFDESAYILIFKSGERDDTWAPTFVEYLKGMAAKVAEDHAAGTPFLLSELPYDHPARVFGRSVGGARA